MKNFSIRLMIIGGAVWAVISTIIIMKFIAPSDDAGARMTESEARAIAEQSCVKGGAVLAPGEYNESTKTWWYDANLNATRPGCSPACVVSERTRTAEVNWRCTGAIVPTTE